MPRKPQSDPEVIVGSMDMGSDTYIYLTLYSIRHKRVTIHFFLKVL